MPRAHDVARRVSGLRSLVYRITLRSERGHDLAEGAFVSPDAWRHFRGTRTDSASGAESEHVPLRYRHVPIHLAPATCPLPGDRQRMRLRRCIRMVVLNDRAARRGRGSARLMCAPNGGRPRPDSRLVGQHPDVGRYMVMRTRRLPAVVRSRLLFCFVLLVSGLAWYSYLTYESLEERLLTTMRGTLVSSSVKPATGDSSFLDFRIQESPLRFRAPVDVYDEYFDQGAFRREARPGLAIEFAVKTQDLHDPNKPLLDSLDTVFVLTMRSEATVFADLAGRRSCEATESRVTLYVGIAFSLIALVCLVKVCRNRLSAKRGPQQDVLLPDNPSGERPSVD